jgi:hypothetical protein
MIMEDDEDDEMLKLFLTEPTEEYDDSNKIDEVEDSNDATEDQDEEDEMMANENILPKEPTSTRYNLAKSNQEKSDHLYVTSNMLLYIGDLHPPYVDLSNPNCILEYIQDYHFYYTRNQMLGLQT